MAIEDELARLCLEITNHPSIGTTKRNSRVRLYHQESCATDGEIASDKNDLWGQSRQDLFRWICRNEDRRREARGLPGAPLLKSVAVWPDEPTALMRHLPSLLRTFHLFLPCHLLLNFQ